MKLIEKGSGGFFPEACGKTLPTPFPLERVTPEPPVNKNKTVRIGVRPHWALTAMVMVATVGCASRTRLMTETAERVESLRSSAVGIGEAWLHGDVSGTYAKVALEETFRLLDKALIELHSVPPLLADPRGASLSIRAETLCRGVARLMAHMEASDGAAARQDLAAIATLGEEAK
ncbi:MAG TPA: hypothetical protein VL243_07705 [Vicinamibacterales bacterium]|jgi:hypothetical protein|nr:hypothetical protein [Vicinamibacterales bacterium]